tara:strand:+ start:554 stop:937 length:384 start_codon:yes stop_codon:yes gene_type:complete
MRIFAISLILVSELAIVIGVKSNLNADNISLISTLIVVLFVSFTMSAILNQIKSLKLKKNYLISRIVGIVVAIVYYLWIKANMDRMMAWLDKNGLYFLLFLIAVGAIMLFFTNYKKSAKRVLVDEER